MANSSGLPRTLVPRGGPIYDGKVDGRAASVAADPVRRALLVSVMTSADSILSPSRSASGPPAPPRLGSLDVLALSVWCGLAGGLLEVGARVIRKTFFSPDWFCWMSRHFVWLIPLTDLIVFAVLGVLLAVAVTLWPRRGRWIAPRLIVVLTVLPVLNVLIPGIYPSAWFLVALGQPRGWHPSWSGTPRRWRRGMLATSPALVAAVVLLAGWRLGGPWLAERREAARPMPAGDPPNVILITLDTVRADHLSLHGYERPTSPILEVLARSGIRFDAARAASPWTLPSHATLFTGAWPHQLGVAWNRPLDETYPTLAGLLGSRGYATAAFVANTHYCSYETGLLRGFAHSEDYVLPYLLPFRTSWLFDRAVGDLTSLGEYLGQAFDVGPLRPFYESWLTPYTLDEWRKDAGSINRAFLDWLGRRPQPARPFFAFLNYYDAHSPYVLPTAAGYRFGLAPRRASDFLFLTSQWTSVDRLTLRPAYRKLAQDSYDNCIAFLDEQVGVLVRDLGRSGVLDHTWLIVTADHGEGMGEHGLFDHGESLYAQEIHVPLVIVPPAGRRAARKVREPVSLRDLPATILDVVGLAGRSSFPGRSLAPLWRDRASGSNPTAETGPVLSELPSPSPDDPNRGRSPARKGPLVAIAEGNFVYIRNMGDGAEELYNEREDQGETRDLGHDPASRPTLERLRRRSSARPPGTTDPAAKTSNQTYHCLVSQLWRSKCPENLQLYLSLVCATCPCSRSFTWIVSASRLRRYNGDFYLTRLLMTGEVAAQFTRWVEAALTGEAMAKVVEIRREEELIATEYEFERAQTAVVGERERTWTERVQVIRSEAAAQSQATALERRLEKAEAAVRGLTPPPGPGRVPYSTGWELDRAVTAVLAEHHVEGLLEVSWERQDWAAPGHSLARDSHFRWTSFWGADQPGGSRRRIEASCNDACMAERSRVAMTCVTFRSRGSIGFMPCPWRRRPDRRSAQ